jgi:site-specific recombinase XerD
MLLQVVGGDVRVWVALAALGGLRRREIAELRPGDVHRDDDGGTWLRVAGKGGRARMVPMVPLAAQLLHAYSWPQVSPSTVGRKVGQAMRAAGVDATCHQLRHACATSVLAADRDVSAVQALLGHASVATTMVYAQVQTDRVRQAVHSAFGSWAA